MSQGLFITFESTSDGLGKTTQAKLLSERLESEGFSTVVTYEPNNPQIRHMLKSKDVDLSENAEILLFFADRAQHVDKVIFPALQEGKIVICDRFVDSSYAYQGYGRGHSMTKLKQLADIATFGLTPELTILLDGIPFRSMDDTDRFESLDSEFYTRVRTAFLHLAVQEPDRFYTVNVNADLAVTSDNIYKHVKKRLNTSLINW